MQRVWEHAVGSKSRGQCDATVAQPGPGLGGMYYQSVKEVGISHQSKHCIKLI